MNELLGWYGYERLELRRWAASRARDASSPEQAAEQKNKGIVFFTHSLIRQFFFNMIWFRECVFEINKADLSQ